MPSSALDFERAKSYLQQCDENGHSIYQHLVSMLSLASKQSTIPSLLQLSMETKSLSLKSPASINQPVTPQHHANTEAELSRSLQLVKNDISLSSSLIATTHTSPPQSIPPNIKIQDLLSLSSIISESGLSFSSSELLTLQFTMTRLCQTKNLSNISFWGIIRGLNSDYFIFETKISPSPSKIPKTIKTKKDLAALDKTEESGRGVNEYKYYVSSHLNDLHWSLLPELVPDAIIKSRQIHKLLTGNLETSIAGHPDFPYNESMLLRAMIARISHSAFLSPKGAMTTNPYDEELLGPGENIINDETWEGINVSESASLESWAHSRAKITKKGRTTKFNEPEIETEEEENEENAKENENPEEEEEETTELLTTLENDSIDSEPASSPSPLYSIKSSPNSRHPHGIISVKSFLWPGSLSLAQHKTIVNIYIGYGIKRQLKPFVPAPMSIISEEFNGLIENEEGEQINILNEQEDPILTVDLNDEEGENDEENNENDDEENEEEEQNED